MYRLHWILNAKKMQGFYSLLWASFMVDIFWISLRWFFLKIAFLKKMSLQMFGRYFWSVLSIFSPLKEIIIQNYFLWVKLWWKVNFAKTKIWYGESMSVKVFLINNAEEIPWSGSSIWSIVVVHFMHIARKISHSGE